MKCLTVRLLIPLSTLAAAMQRKDWRTVAAKYNGTGAIDQYSKLLEQAYNNLGGS